MKRNENILIVDDSPAIRSFLCSILDEEGFGTLLADNGEDALALLENNTPDLILLDIRMPGIDGFEVCKRIKQKETLFEIPIIFLSSATAVDDKIEGLRIGAVDYITKPFKKEELMARMKTHLSLREKEMELKNANKELLLAKEKAEKNEALFNAFMEHAPVFAYIKDEKRTQIYSNQISLEITKNKEFEQLKIHDLLDAENAGKQKDAEEQILNGVSIYQELEYTTRFDKRHTREIWLKDIKFPIKMPDGKKLLGGMAIDITQKKRAEEELRNYQNNLEELVKKRTEELYTSNEELKTINEELHEQKNVLEKTLKRLNETHAQLIQSDKMASLGVLIAGVAHEINNPVNFINSSLVGLKTNMNYLGEYISLIDKITIDNCKSTIELIEKKEVSISEIFEMFKKSIQIIGVGIERTTKIVKGLKSFAHSNQNKIELYKINENLENTLMILQNQYKNRIEILKEYKQVPDIKCYPGQINQVLMNILVNAMQSIKDKGKLWITTGTKNEHNIYIHIKDTGSGIPENVIEHIFDPFFTTKEAGQGTGLGLSISYNIIQAHHGDIAVESEVGKGTCFKITLPIEH